MRHFLIIIISVIYIKGNTQWNVIPSGTGAGYGSLFYKSGRLITYGNGATGLLISDDEGNSFTPIGIGTAINVASFSSINIGYAMARTNPFNLNSSPHITTDGGSTWSPIANPIQQLVHSIFAINDSTAIYGTSWGRLWKTTDWGNSFNFIHSNALITSSSGGKEIRKLHFISDNVGFASTGDLVMTTDGGLTWNIVSDTTNGSMNWYISEICFPSANIGYISGLNGLLAKTTDGGLTWDDLSISDSNYIYGIDFLNPNFGVILNSEKNILRTDDGGINWTAGSTGYLMSKCKMIDHSTVVAVGANGIIIKTTTLNINQATKSNHSIVLYPNPTNEIITVNLKNTEDEVKVRLHSSLGKVILSNQYFNTDNIKISILQEPGIYILEVILTNSKYSFKVIKK